MALGDFNLRAVSDVKIPVKGEFNLVVTDDTFELNESNRSIVIWSSYIAGLKDTTIMYLVWDRVDETMYMRVQKNPIDRALVSDAVSKDVTFDQMNQVESLDHRIYPALVDGAPNVASQLVSLKSGYTQNTLPEGNSMTAEIINLNEIQLTFENQIFSNSVEPQEIIIVSLPKGYILGLSLGQPGKGYLDGEIAYLIGDHGFDAICQVSVSSGTTAVVSASVINSSRGFYEGRYPTSYNPFYTQGSGSGLEVYAYVNGDGQVTSVDITNGGSGYRLNDVIDILGGNYPATITITEIDGGQVTSVKIPEWGGYVTTTVDDYGKVRENTTQVTDNYLAGGVLYQVGDVLTIESGDGTATAVVTSVVTNQVYDPNQNDLTFNTYGGTWSAQQIKVGEVNSDEKKTFTLNISGFDLQYDTTYKVLATDVLNMAKQSTSMEDFVVTATQPQPCPAMTSILFEAYGNGPVTLGTASYTTGSHASNKFMYFGVAGLSWAEFTGLAEFTGANPEIIVPSGVTAPTTVYAYYRSGTYLLPDSSWIVGIVGSETDYQGNYEYVLYTLDNILNYKQLTPAGSSTDTCGTSGWGGDWGSSIQQFRINR